MTQDEFDQDSITQLHEAVIELSKSCFELKKLCAAVLGVAMTLIAALTKQDLDPAMFVGGALLITFFWIADAQSYYYQDKLRGKISLLQREIAKRNGLTVPGGGAVSLKRQERGAIPRAFLSLFNFSMLFYFGLFVIDAVLFVAYVAGLLVLKT
jgi:lipid-A-disaccharide synthase-like uncharacterized protein